MAQCKAQILKDGFETKSYYFVAAFLEQGWITKLAHGGIAGGFRRYAIGFELLRYLLAVKRHLFLQIAIEGLPAQQDPNLPQQTDQGIHTASCGSSRTRPMAAIMFWNFETSIPNCFRPAAVKV